MDDGLFETPDDTPNVHIKARISLLRAEDGGRATMVVGGQSYRPNHNFFGPENRTMAIGFIDLPEGCDLPPGGSVDVEMILWGWARLIGEIYPGRTWLIQEGHRLVGSGEVLEVLS